MFRATEILTSERRAFELEKKAHAELYELQQSEMRVMLESHRTQNEEWIEKMRIENDNERKQLAEQKVCVYTYVWIQLQFCLVEMLDFCLALSSVQLQKLKFKGEVLTWSFFPYLSQAVLEKDQAELATDRLAFTEKSRKLDAIMKQVQGLQEP